MYDRLMSAYSWLRFVGALAGVVKGNVTMRGMSALAAVGLCLLAAASARAQGLAPAAEPGSSRPADPGWSEQDIQLAQARCTVLLKGLDVVAVPAGPLREGSECGAPAPMRLISVGKEPQVAFSPPPTLTCDMIAALHKWVQRDVQPLARRLLAAPIVRIETMSSYSCRNAYGRAHGRLSEHGRANAVDIGSFVTALGHAALVVSDWGLTAREVAAAAAAKAQPPAAGSAPPPISNVVNSAARSQGLLSVAPPVESPGTAAAEASTGLRLGIPGVLVQIGGRSDQAADSAFAPAQRLGGPKAKTTPAAAPVDVRLDFLRGVHAAACRQFGTVLGPEANHAHKNHFHIDMAQRPHGTICE
jgi:hypothetical protein